MRSASQRGAASEVSLPRVLPSLTGLRAIAAGVVFFRHAEYLYGGTVLEPYTRRLFVQGTVGVSFFYVLSGFVLTWSWREGVLSFFRRRFARIYPVYALTWGLGGLVALYVGLPVTITIAAATLALVQAWIPSEHYFIGMNGVSWSLSCEAFFYALFPFLFFGLTRLPSTARRALLFILVGGVIALPSVVPESFGLPGFIPGSPVGSKLWAIYIFPPARLLEFTAGVLIALEVRAGRWPRLPLAVVAGLGIAGYLGAGEAGLWHSQTFTPEHTFAAVTIIPFVLVICAFALRDIDRRPSFLRSTLAIRLGEWSYSFYLIHFLVILVFRHATEGWEPGVLGAIMATVGLLATSLALAASVYTFVERPLERRLRGSLRPPTQVLERRTAQAHA
jgi:peptidoglycan/LPS O-acetylase OafA/YrhL